VRHRHVLGGTVGRTGRHRRHGRRGADRRAPEIEDPLVVASLGDGTPDRLAAAAGTLNDNDIAIVQHEYGIYGGPDGADVVALINALTVPTIVVAHTVVQNPTPNQRLVLERVCDASDAVM
jgi:hypothetical protein